MRSGKLAERAGVNPQTLRYYERRGLLDTPPRSGSGCSWPTVARSSAIRTRGRRSPDGRVGSPHRWPDVDARRAGRTGRHL
ncbi:MAG TPA: MerR family DNA-binding transcriptional regulator [Pseudonocardiaceae bacterium]